MPKPAPKNFRPGIRIRYAKKNGFFQAEFFAGRGVSSPNFVTNPAIRTALTLTPVKPQARIGYIKAEYDLKDREWKWGFFPLGHHAAEDIPLSKFGIAQLLELRALKEAAYWFPSIRKIVPRQPTEMRQLQLQKRGHTTDEIRQGYGMNREIELLRRKIAKDHEKYLPKNRKSGHQNLK